MHLHLDDSTIEQLLDPRAAEVAVWDAFAAWGRGEAATTQRVRAAAPTGMASAMAAVVPPYSGGKLYATAAGRFTFVNVLFDIDGALLCTLDGDAITRLRTPAASSLAIHHLARPDATIATVVGGGIQGWSHVRMLADHLPSLTELRLVGRPGSPSVAALTERARAAGLPVVTPTTIVDGVRDAHVVVTLTSASEPLFPVDAVSDEALVCAVGATKYDRAELDPEFVGRCRAVVCDDAVGSRVECGDLLRAVEAGTFDWSDAVELHDVAAGVVEIPRTGNGPVLFETQGVAIQDVAVAALAWQRHLATTDSSAHPSPPTDPPGGTP